jgi:hypothetical protein
MIISDTDLGAIIPDIVLLATLAKKEAVSLLGDAETFAMGHVTNSFE